MSSGLKIWCDDSLSERARQRLVDAVNGAHRLLPVGAVALAAEKADVALGQPTAEFILSVPRVRWVHITIAGFTSYDREPVRRAMQERGTVVTNSSLVYADACAQHALAMILATGRQLLPAYRAQLTDHAWLQFALRDQAQLLTGQTVLLLGFGSIGQRLAELLAPFRTRTIALRRQPRGGEKVEIVDLAALQSVLPLADHIVNVLPLNERTAGLMTAECFSLLREGAVFYNLGRGGTVDQDALVAALKTGRIRTYLDVTTPEPLPADHALWSLPNCHITPHAAGGGQDEEKRQIDHFLENLDRFHRGDPLVNRVI